MKGGMDAPSGGGMQGGNKQGGGMSSGGKQQEDDHYDIRKNLKKTYFLGGEEVHALDDVSLSIKEHEFVAIIGQSGSGKSTFMNMLGCLDRPDSGEITLDGTDILKCKEKELSVIRNKKIGFIFQQFHLLPKLSALENVELPLIYQGMPTKKRREKAVKALKAVGLEKRMNHKPNQLSGGQQQRVDDRKSVSRRAIPDPCRRTDRKFRFQIRKRDHDVAA